MHVHHRHQRDIPTVTLVGRDDATSAMPTLSATSYTYAIEVPTAEKSKDYGSNPYIFKPNMPQNLVFIIMGGIIGLLLICFVVYHIVSYLISNRKAKNEKEVYYNFSDSNSLFHDGASTYSGKGLPSSNSSLWEKSTILTGGVGNSSNASIYMMNKHNSMINFSQRSLFDSTTISGDSSHPGRSYRSAVNNLDSPATSDGSSPSLHKIGHRGSMFISPVLEIVNNGHHRKSFSNFDLPYDKRSNGSEASLGIPTTMPMLSAFDTDSSFNVNSVVGSGFDSPAVSTPISEFHAGPDFLMNDTKPEIKSRPPSQYLEDLINDQDYLAEYVI